MYCQYYSLKERPFNITPDPKYLFLSPQHQDAFNHLWFGVTERKGFIQLTGEVGCGKTTLCRGLLDKLEESKYSTALVLNPVMTENQMLMTILNEFGIVKKGRGRARNYELLNNFLLEKAKEEKEALLIIDEAQDLTTELLEFVRLLSNLETDNQKLLQVILVGQPELKEKINDPAIRQLRQRITVRFHLEKLSLQETQRYIEYRMNIAGANGIPYFEKGALKKIHRYAGGIPRLINAVADRALLAGYVHGSYNITGKLVRQAEKELEGNFK